MSNSLPYRYVFMFTFQVKVCKETNEQNHLSTTRQVENLNIGTPTKVNGCEEGVGRAEGG